MKMRNAILLLVMGVALQMLGACTTYRHTESGISKTVGVPRKRLLKGEKILRHEGYCVAFNKRKNVATWSAWTITAERTKGKTPRYSRFEPDSLLKSRHRATHADYKKSGYSRGHLSPAADNKYSAQAIRECFYMSNIAPQTSELNEGGWLDLENACRRWAVQYDTLYVVAGPLFDGKKPARIGRKVEVAVPDGFFKVVMTLKNGQEKAIGFIFRNDKSVQTMREAACSVRKVERKAKLNFFPHVARCRQECLETEYDLDEWLR